MQPLFLVMNLNVRDVIVEFTFLMMLRLLMRVGMIGEMTKMKMIKSDFYFFFIKYARTRNLTKRTYREVMEAVFEL